MPYLNPPDVLPEAMRFMARALLASGNSIPESELLRLVSPTGLVEALGGEIVENSKELKGGGQIIAKASLKAMRDSEYVNTDSSRDRLISLTPIVTDYFKAYEDVTAQSFAAFVRTTSLRDASDTFSDDENEGGAEDLAIGLAMLLIAPKPLAPFGTFDAPSGKAFSRFQVQQLGTEIANWVVRNPVRYPPLERWAVYLGYARADVTGLIVDPSHALEEAVQVFLGRDDMVLSRFLDELGVLMPSSDRGRVGVALGRRMADPPRTNELFPGVALGLLTLENEGLIRLSNKSDAESFEFPLGNVADAHYSHVRLEA